MARPHMGRAILFGVRHVLFAAFILAMLLYGSQNWHQYAAVLMVTAWVKHGGRLNARVW